MSRGVARFNDHGLSDFCEGAKKIDVLKSITSVLDEVGVEHWQDGQKGFLAFAFKARQRQCGYGPEYPWMTVIRRVKRPLHERKTIIEQGLDGMREFIVIQRLYFNSHRSASDWRFAAALCDHNSACHRCIQCHHQL
ncbi:hypothetical protein D3C84_577780 [compost metagenome]